MLLLRLPSVALTLYLTERTSLMSSFVVVFPFVPVSAMTVSGLPFTNVIDLCQRASSCSVLRVSSTGISLSSAIAAAAESLLITAYAAPASKAFMAYSFPSKFSPLRAKNNSPPLIFLLSVVTEPQLLYTLYISAIFIIFLYFQNHRLHVLSHPEPQPHPTQPSHSEQQQAERFSRQDSQQKARWKDSPE